MATKRIWPIDDVSKPCGRAQRFVAQAAQHEGADCLIWPYSTNALGYGFVRFGGRARMAHWAVCTMANGQWPTPKHQAAHTCGNGHLGCVNPCHLRWATVSENQLDKRIHGTMPRCENHHWAKLSDREAEEIREEGAAVTNAELARKYGVNPSTISLIRRGKRRL